MTEQRDPRFAELDTAIAEANEKYRRRKRIEMIERRNRQHNRAQGRTPYPPVEDLLAWAWRVYDKRESQRRNLGGGGAAEPGGGPPSSRPRGSIH